MPSQTRLELKIPGFLNDYLAVRVPRSAALFVACVAWIGGTLITIMSPFSAWVFVPILSVLGYFLFLLVRKDPRDRILEPEKKTKFVRLKD